MCPGDSKRYLLLPFSRNVIRNFNSVFHFALQHVQLTRELFKKLVCLCHFLLHTRTCVLAQKPYNIGTPFQGTPGVPNFGGTQALPTVGNGWVPPFLGTPGGPGIGDQYGDSLEVTSLLRSRLQM